MEVGTRYRGIEQLDRVVDGELLAELAGVGGDLEDAAGVGGDDGAGAGREQALGLAAAELGGRLGLEQVVDAGRAAADLPALGLAELEAGDLAEQVPRLLADRLRVGEVAGVVVGG
jgi:hypothetical protein